MRLKMQKKYLEYFAKIIINYIEKVCLAIHLIKKKFKNGEFEFKVMYDNKFYQNRNKLKTYLMIENTNSFIQSQNETLNLKIRRIKAINNLSQCSMVYKAFESRI